MDNLEKINITKKELDYSLADRNLSLKSIEEFDAQFFRVKIGVMTFIGVIFTIIFSRDDFQIKLGMRYFFTVLLSITFLAFILLIHDLWRQFKHYNEDLKNKSRRACLCNIRHASMIEKCYPSSHSNQEKFVNYAQEAFNLKEKDHEILQDMKNNEPIEDILEKRTPELLWRFNFFVWSVIFLSIPVLFLLKLLNFLI